VAFRSLLALLPADAPPPHAAALGLDRLGADAAAAAAAAEAAAEAAEEGLDQARVSEEEGAAAAAGAVGGGKGGWIRREERIRGLRARCGDLELVSARQRVSVGLSGAVRLPWG
jgi:hypothetical protein